MHPTVQDLHDGRFKTDGSYQRTFSGYGSVPQVLHAFLSIEGQQQWNSEVRAGHWETGNPETVGSVRHLSLRGTMWTRQQITEANSARLCYVFLESGGGMPFAHGRFLVDIEAESPEENGPITLKVEMNYRLARAFRLMKSVVNKATESNLDECLCTILDPAP